VQDSGRALAPGHRIKVTIAIGLALIAVAVALTLTRAPASLARRNTHEDQVLGGVDHAAEYCQSGELLPSGATAIRVHVYAEYGPRVAVTLSERGRTIAHGQQGVGWTGGAVTVPLRALARSRSPARLCIELALNGDETISLFGEQTSTALAARAGHTTLPGRITVEYLRPGRSSWWSLLPEVARRAGLGHAPSGTWGVGLAAALMAGVLALCSGLLVRELR
jgi:hypothetical protein